MILLEGTEFEREDPGVVAEYLSATPRECLDVNPSNLSVKHDGKYLMLQVVNGKVREYPIRKSFLFKLLKWYSFPVNQLQRLSMDTITGLCNDYLLNIKADNVRVKTENGQALTIVSNKYNDFPDLEVIERCRGLGIDKISRSDFVLRIYTHEKFKTEPVPGDACGFGLNIINSETGFGALSITHYILRYVCTNGAVAPVEGADDSKVHYGNREGALEFFLNEQIRKAFESRFKLVKFLRESTGLKAEGFVKLIGLKVERLIGRRGWMEMLEGLGESGTKYDLFNLITDKAKEFGVGQRLYLERVAGEMIVEQ